MLESYQFPALGDNYGYLLHDPRSGQTAAIDAPDAGAVLAALDEKGWRLSHILNTHHHYDHTDGNLALKEKTGCLVIAAAADAGRIPGLDRPVREGDRIAIGTSTATVLETPGHTSGHVSYLFSGEGLAFTGDTLFSLGCGRLFEGTPAQMWASLQKLMALPPETRICCAHEYTLSNGEFALEIDPDNAALHAMMDKLRARRRAGRPTVPSRLADERQANPFLRPSDPAIRRHLGMESSSDVEVFAEIRRRKDRF